MKNPKNKEMKTIVEMKDITTVKLSITNEEIRIKFPLGFTEIDSCVTKLQEIAKKVIPVKNVLRGNVYKGEILLTSGNRKIQKRFVL